ncbi:STAS/SEC14 domain-containing protein [Geobacter sp. SVR]|uniref:STAS/SEC14 domain-containing protein n=1 Tax=Geobacter sp. SVR TaxID=2495594 RepID=UPI00143EF9B2|nr:STAS/SEC14 domain-containing protein [Geobacter sp. SVR]BCS52891.1 hypothetical protein GSVR_11990 [Geobacter sp. SVR]GCF87513.1 hypothetical protein GSbR_41130 [Geobacter sp. SVR]
MGATVRQESSGILVVNISGGLLKEEMDGIQAAAMKRFGPQENARVLVVIESDFRGWVGDEAWNDMSFFIEHGDKIAKIAIVGDPKWETRMLMFAGAGFRRAPVKYFASGRLNEAYAWLG